MNIINSIEKWFEIAKPNRTKEDLSVQVGANIEEFCETLDALGIERSKELDILKSLAYSNRLDTKELDKEALLDGLCDQIVTAVGVAYMIGFDIEKALEEVNRSNYSKFEDGKALFNEKGKIIKGANYTEPNLKPYLTKNQDWKERVERERDNLLEKTKKLIKFMNSEKINELSEFQKILLATQSSIMATYLGILEMRLSS